VNLSEAVIAPASGIPQGALSGTYAGVGAEASAGAGVGANVLVGGTGRAFSLQPISVEGQLGLNVAGGVTTVVSWGRQAPNRRLRRELQKCRPDDLSRPGPTDAVIR